MSEPRRILVRPCFEQDIEQVTLIYGHHVLTGAGTFELAPPSQAEMHERWSAVVTNGWPYLVASPADDLTRVLGFAYAAPFRPRAAYARTFEDSIYVAPSAMGQGIGTFLIADLLLMLRDDDVREVIAVIGDSGNAASIALHKTAGFTHQGVIKNVGYKFERWVDVVFMQKSLRKPEA